MTDCFVGFFSQKQEKEDPSDEWRGSWHGFISHGVRHHCCHYLNILSECCVFLVLKLHYNYVILDSKLNWLFQLSLPAEPSHQHDSYQPHCVKIKCCVKVLTGLRSSFHIYLEVPTWVEVLFFFPPLMCFSPVTSAVLTLLSSGSGSTQTCPFWGRWSLSRPTSCGSISCAMRGM